MRTLRSEVEELQKIAKAIEEEFEKLGLVVARKSFSFFRFGAIALAKNRPNPRESLNEINRRFWEFSLQN